MTLQNPANLLWFAPLAGIIFALYLLRMRRRDVRVPVTFLWPQHTEEIRANSLFQKLRFNWLMVLQLLAAALVCFAFARPQIRQQGLLGDVTVIVLDTSASMKSKDGSPTRFEDAKELAIQAINTSKPGDRIALIDAGSSPKVVFSLSNDPSKQRGALQKVKPTDTEGNMGEALRLASALVSSLDSARILVLSDGCFPPVENFSSGKASIVYKSFGYRAENLAIQALGATKTARGNEVYCGIKNFGLNQASVSVALYADGKLFATKALTLASQKSGGVTLQCPSGARILEAKLDSKDLMPADDYLVTSVDPNATLSVLLISAGNPFLERALLLDPRVSLDRSATLPTSERTAANSRYDLIIFDAIQPEDVQSRAVLSFGVAGPGTGVTSGGKISSPSINDITASPLVSGVDFRSAFIDNGVKMKLGPGMRTVVDSSAGPIVAISDGDVKRVAVAFNTLNSDFPLQVGFPIFISNVLDFVSAGTQLSDLTIRTGGQFALRTEDSVNLNGPEGFSENVTSTGGQAILRNFTSVGTYTAKTDNKPTKIFAYLRSDVESDIAPKPDVNLAGGKLKATQTPFRLQDYWRLAILFLLAVLGFEWWLFARKS